MGKIDLVNWKSNTLSQRSKNLTTLSALYTIAETILKDKNYSSKVLPITEELEEAYKQVASFWSVSLENIQVFQKYLELTRDDLPVSKLRELFNDIRAFIDDEYAEEHDEEFYEEYDGHSDEISTFAKSLMLDKPRICADECSNPTEGKSLEEYLRKMDRSFSEMLFDLIDESGMSDVECYKRANVDKRTFSKIKSNKGYKPSKQTAIAFAISLKLNIDQTQELLQMAKLILMRSCTISASGIIMMNLLPRAKCLMLAILAALLLIIILSTRKVGEIVAWLVNIPMVMVR